MPPKVIDPKSRPGTRKSPTGIVVKQIIDPLDDKQARVVHDLTPIPCLICVAGDDLQNSLQALANAGIRPIGSAEGSAAVWDSATIGYRAFENTAIVGDSGIPHKLSLQLTVYVVKSAAWTYSP